MGNPSIKNIGAFIKSAAGTVPAAASAGTRTSAAVDRMGFGSCVMVGYTGATSGTPTTLSAIFTLQDSDDGSTGWADFQSDGENDETVSLTAASSTDRKNVNLGGAKRYIRVSEVVAFTGGTSPTVGAASGLILGGAVTKPTT